MGRGATDAGTTWGPTALYESGLDLRGMGKHFEIGHYADTLHIRLLNRRDVAPIVEIVEGVGALWPAVKLPVSLKDRGIQYPLDAGQGGSGSPL